MSSALLLLLLSLLAGKYVSASPGRLLSQLRPLSLSQRLNSLLTGHSREYRPVRDWRTVTVVSIDFSVQAVLDVVTVRRRPLFYMVNLILPSALLLLLDVLGYLIPPYYKQRLSYKSTTFTGYFIFILMVFSLFPPFRGSLPLIDLPEEGTVANSLDGSEAESAAWRGKGGEELRALGEMKREVERMRRWLHSLRQERESQCVRRELVTLLDLLYLFLHCLTLLLGTVLFCMLWNMRL
ncbi:5-hydroxytryptamine receptor 3A [Acipenser ruthenus]|uniref:5-hydroxytryptamine receptor 3A n=1 Tax=Acipenser ruthenus TaxID=7906 RepID=A0A662YYE8_ACIRT|nr:5-hydroxytryptamine receptor 3A [Acipenser ruthenus]